MDGFGPLISTAWLAENLTDPRVRVLDCTVRLHPQPGGDMRAESGLADFEKEHIPGAGFADLIEDLSAPESPLRFTLPGAARFEGAMGALGVSDDTRLVLYAEQAHWATRLWWMLRNFGFDAAGILDGGLHAWKADGRPLEAGPPRPAAPKTFIASETRDLFCNMSAVQQAIGDTGIVTINALLPEQHAGTGGADYGRPGRIPGSVCLSARDLVDPQTKRFRPLADLKTDFERIGALSSPEVITYCGGGIAASGDSFVLFLLGQENVRVYDASLQEWARSDLPMDVDT